MTALIPGLAAGLVATIGMTLVMMLMGDGGPPPTAGLVAKVTGGAPEAHARAGMVLHLLYGVLAGVVFAVGVPLLGLEFGSLPTAIALGFVYGLVLMIGGMVFWMRFVIGMEPDRDMIVMFGVVHAVYGVVLGAFIGAGIIT